MFYIFLYFKHIYGKINKFKLMCIFIFIFDKKFKKVEIKCYSTKMRGFPGELKIPRAQNLPQMYAYAIVLSIQILLFVQVIRRVERI